MYAVISPEEMASRREQRFAEKWVMTVHHSMYPIFAREKKIFIVSYNWMVLNTFITKVIFCTLSRGNHAERNRYFNLRAYAHCKLREAIFTKRFKGACPEKIC